ncbi:hypothetical protein D3C76_1160370 [compost metagenome]
MLKLLLKFADFGLMTDVLTTCHQLLCQQLFIGKAGFQLLQGVFQLSALLLNGTQAVTMAVAAGGDIFQQSLFFQL